MMKPSVQNNLLHKLAQAMSKIAITCSTNPEETRKTAVYWLGIIDTVLKQRQIKVRLTAEVLTGSKGDGTQHKQGDVFYVTPVTDPWGHKVYMEFHGSTGSYTQWTKAHIKKLI